LKIGFEGGKVAVSEGGEDSHGILVTSAGGLEGFEVDREKKERAGEAVWIGDEGRKA